MATFISPCSLPKSVGDGLLYVGVVESKGFRV
jgi:hypothetical protein